MMRSVLVYATIFLFVLGVGDLFARPCNQAELAAHKMVGSKGQCFQPDPHPLPHNIAWPGAKSLGDTYIYFINSSLQPIKIYTLAPEEEGEAPIGHHIVTLSPRTYTWDGLDSFGDYAIVSGNASVDLDEERVCLKREGPAIYKFYNIQVNNDKVTYRNINENDAVNLMRNMKYGKRLPNGEIIK